MAEDRGGLQYDINVGGNFDAKIDGAISKLKKLEKQFGKFNKTLSKPSSSPSGGGGGGGSSGNAVIRRETSLLNQQAVARERGLDSLEKTVKFDKNSAKIQRDISQQFRDRKVLADALGKASAEAAREDKARLARLSKYDDSTRATQQELFNSLKAQSLEEEKKAQFAEKARRYNDVNLQAQERISARARDLKIKQAEINQLTKAGNTSQRRAAEQVGLTSAQAKQLGLNMWDAEHAARQFLFTFRRLVGILAVFTLARKFAQAIGDAVGEMKDFNAELETAQIGMAAIISSIAEVRDSTGNLLPPAEAFNAALGESGDLINQLRQDALGSISTFQELVRAYQVAVGPGLAAGLSLDQIKNVSNELAVAAKTLGIPINQLSEEIRSLLQGTATARNTRIAVLFGGAQQANEEIRRAKEVGNLYEVLTGRLEAFGAAAEESGDSFAVASSNLQDAIQNLLAIGGIEYFEQLKDTLNGLRQALVTEGPDGGLIFSEDALDIVRSVSSGLADIITTLQDVTDSQDALSGLGAAIGVLSDATVVFVRTAGPLFSGLVDGALAFLEVVQTVTSILRGLSDLLDESVFGKGLKTAAKYAASLYGFLFLSAKVSALHLSLWGSKGMLGVLKRVVTWMVLASNTQKGITIRTVATTLASDGWLAALKLINLETALISGGITIILGSLAFLLVKLGVVDSLTSAITGNIKGMESELDGAQKEADKLSASFGTSSKYSEEINSNIKETRESLSSVLADLERTAFFGALEGPLASLAKLEFDRRQEVTKTRKEADAELRVLENRNKELKASLSLEKELTEAFASQIKESGGVDLSDPSSVEGFNEAYAKTKTLQAEIASNEVEIASITESRISSVESINALYEARRRIISKAQQSQAEFNASIGVAQQEYQNILTEVASRTLSQRQQEINETKASLELQRKKLLLLEETNKRQVQQAFDLTGLTREQRIGTQEQVLQRAAVAGTVEETREYLRLREKATVEEEKSTAAIQATEDALRRLEPSPDFTSTLRDQLETFANEELSVTLSEKISEAIVGSLSDLSGVVADVFKDAIDPRTDADLRTAFGEFFLDLAGQFVEAITQQLIADLVAGALPALGSLGGQGGESTPVVTALGTQTTTIVGALQAQTAALTAQGGGAQVASSFVGPPAPASGAQDAGAKAAGTALGSFLGSAGAVLPYLLPILIPLVIGLLSQAFKKGGQVQGFADGGGIGTAGKASPFQRPANIPASDTVPAWLTPGEFVIKRDSVKKYGAGFLSAINSGVLKPSSFAGAFAMGGPVRGVQSFADGGGVRSVQTGSRSAMKPIIQPVLVADNNSLDQMVAGGRDSFTRNVNKVNYTGDPNRSGSW